MYILEKLTYFDNILTYYYILEKLTYFDNILLHIMQMSLFSGQSN